MVNLVVTKRSGETLTLNTSIGMSVMEVIRDAGIDEMLALCGGACSCATCHVHVEPEFSQSLPPVSNDESGLLDGCTERDARSRLGCQIRLMDNLSGLRVTIAKQE